jgi:hypothetical protein
MGNRSLTTAQSLRIRVTRDGEPELQLTFPAWAAASLDDLIPDDLKPFIAPRHQELHESARSAASEGYPCGDLLQVDQNGRRIRVWLE